MKAKKIADILTEQTDYEITDSEAQTLLDDIDESSIQSEEEGKVSYQEKSKSDVSDILEGHDKDPEIIYEVKNGDSTFYQFYKSESDDDIQSVVDQLIESRVNSRIVQQAQNKIGMVVQLPPPEPNEAKQNLFAHATDSSGWGWSRSKLRTVRREEGLFFDFLDANNFEEAKVEATDSDNLTESETQWIHDLLDGAL